MANPQTCGQGLAEHSALPEKLSGLIVAMAKILERHMTALDLKDENSLELQLVELLQTRLEEDRHMLVDMAGAGRRG